jgi:hypothetical protein
VGNRSSEQRELLTCRFVQSVIENKKMSFSEKTPPQFNGQTDDYSKWKKRFKVWQGCTEVTKAKQGGLVVLRLDDNTQDAVLESVTYGQIKEEDGVDKVITKLDSMFQKDPTFTAFEVYEEFEKYRRPENLPINQYLSEFEKRLSKVKANGTNMSDDVLVYRLLKSANLKESEEQLVKMTVDEMKYENMVKQLKKAFVGSSGGASGGASGLKERIKEERLDADDLVNETMYYNWKRKNQGDRNRNNDDYKDWRDKKQTFGGKYLPKKQRGKNPLDRYGNVTKCRICESINHWEKFPYLSKGFFPLCFFGRYFPPNVCFLSLQSL